ncbi:hypothetical protein WJX81_006229 [Elliptochloris bilobata]|uniref:Purple acid phosphatase n=1 Tax=Elliptochloris bilobata TaxID=381761 RepID=A0AAW1S969_9CHLO
MRGQDTMRGACKYFARSGSCRYGDTCRYAHELPPAVPEARSWCSAAEAEDIDASSSSAGALRVMCYNTLADELAHEHAHELYRSSPRWCLDWRYRSGRLLAEVAHWRPDIGCLQEVDQLPTFQLQLAALGYDVRYVRRTGDRPDGCLTFWRRGCFREVSAEALRLRDLGLRDNVALLVLLEPIPDGGGPSSDGPSQMGGPSGWSESDVGDGDARQPRSSKAGAASDAAARNGRAAAEARDGGGAGAQAPLLLVGNTHLLFNPRRGDIKVAQARVILNRMAALRAAAGRHVLAMLAGDFNSAPGSGVVRFVAAGALDCAVEDRRALSGQLECQARGWRAGRSALQLASPTAPLAPPPDLASAQAAWEEEQRAPAPSSQANGHTAAAPNGCPDAIAAPDPAPGACGAAASSAAAWPSAGASPSKRRKATCSDDEELSVDSEDAALPAEGAEEPLSLQERYRRATCAATLATWTEEQLAVALGLPPPAPPPPPTFRGLPFARRAQPRRGDELPEADWVVRHGLPVRSAYTQVLGAEPLFTSCHGRFTGTVDYIWYTPKSAAGPADAAEPSPDPGPDAPAFTLRAARVLLPPDFASLYCGLPSPEWPSDHISLLAEFEVARADGSHVPLGGALERRPSTCLPTQVHLALTDRDGEMRVSWTTEGTGCLARLHYGRSDSGLWVGCLAPPCAGRNGSANVAVSASSTVNTYSSDDMCGLPASGFSFDPPNLHSAIMTGLDAGESYSYTIGDSGAPLVFRAAPRRGPDAGFSFIVYGDMGESEHRAAKSPGARTTSQRVADEVRDGAELVLHIGDISYSNGDPDIWDTFMDYIEPYASTAPYMLGIGNHEYDWRTGREKRHKHHRRADASGRDRPYDPDWGNYGNDSGGECGVAVARRFLMPGAAGSGAFAGPPCAVACNESSADDRKGNGDDATDGNGDGHADGRGIGDEEANDLGEGNGSACGRRGASSAAPNPPFWYSFEYGSVHFAVISTEHDLTHGSDQREWLEKDLAGVDRCATPWLAVAMHRPFYVVFPHKSNRVVGQHLRASLEDLFEASQVDLVLSGHVHAYARTCNVLDERCVDPADGGMTHFTVGCGGRKLSDVEHEQPDWLAYAEPEWGYGRVTVVGGDLLLFEFVRSIDGEVRDSGRKQNETERGKM